MSVKSIRSKAVICRTTKQVEDMIRAIFFDEEHTLKEYIGGQYIQMGSIEDVMKQFVEVREKHHSPDGMQAVRMGMKVSEAEEKAFGLERLFQMSQDICKLYPDHQILFGLYRDEESLNVYFILNTVAVSNGYKYNPTMEEYYETLDEKKAIAGQYAKEAGYL